MGSMMNVLSKSNVRYVGILSSVDVKECTIGLAQVRCYGTEGRPGKHEVLGSNKVHDHIVFKAIDIQDLFVLGERIASGGVVGKSASQQQQATLIDDPAIVSQSPSASFHVISRSAPPPQPRRPGFVDQEPDFDFESANQQFQREALDCDDPCRRFPGADSSSLPGSVKRNESFYDKKVSFFDTISTGTRTRGSGTNWLRSMKTNEETFGPTTTANETHQQHQGGAIFTPVTPYQSLPRFPRHTPTTYHSSGSSKNYQSGYRPKRSSTFHGRR